MPSPAIERKIIDKLEKVLGQKEWEPGEAHGTVDPYSRQEALRNLGTMDSPKAVAILLKDLKENENTLTLEALGQIAGRTGNLKLLPVFTERLSSESRSTRFMAADTLAKIKHPSAIPHLAALLNDRFEDVRIVAGKALVKIGEELEGKKAEGKAAEALQLVGKHFRPNDGPRVIRKAYHAAYKRKIVPENARLYVKQLRAMEGRLK